MEVTTSDMIYIGIDTGVTTGVAIWDASKQEFLNVYSQKIHYAMIDVLDFAKQYGFSNVIVLVEDARLRKFFKNEPMVAKSQGAGSIKRDAKVWEDFLKDFGIPYKMIDPMSNTTKTTQEYFKKTTNWEGITNEHSRDAGMLVHGKGRNHQYVKKQKKGEPNAKK